MRGNSDSGVLITAVWWPAVKDLRWGSLSGCEVPVDTSQSARDGWRLVFVEENDISQNWTKYDGDLSVKSII